MYLNIRSTYNSSPEWQELKKHESQCRTGAQINWILHSLDFGRHGQKIIRIQLEYVILITNIWFKNSWSTLVKSVQIHRKSFLIYYNWDRVICSPGYSAKLWFLFVDWKGFLDVSNCRVLFCLLTTSDFFFLSYWAPTCLVSTNSHIAWGNISFPITAAGKFI